MEFNVIPNWEGNSNHTTTLDSVQLKMVKWEQRCNDMQPHGINNIQMALYKLEMHGVNDGQPMGLGATCRRNCNIYMFSDTKAKTHQNNQEQPC